jgi:hypothetical protein
MVRALITISMLSISQPSAAPPAKADTVERTFPAAISPLTTDNGQWGLPSFHLQPLRRGAVDEPGQGAVRWGEALRGIERLVPLC